MKYIKPLDGLRALAVILVICWHWLPESSFVNFLPNGTIGVTIFFVLSGFLISNILFEYRDSMDSANTSLGEALKTFYWRRSLRIFPIYYIYILFLLVYGYSLIRESFPYFATYTTNFLFLKNGRLGGTVSHLWSLSVEEQYYFVWPILVLTIQRRFLLHLILLFICTGLLTQYFLEQIIDLGWLLPFFAFDAFGLGGLLAFYVRYKPEKMPQFEKYLNIFALGCAGFVAVHYFMSMSFYYPRRIIMSSLSLWLILKLTKSGNGSFSTILKNFFSNNGLVYIGKISYGMYLYHTIIPGFVDNFNNRLSVLQFLFSNQWIAFFVNFLALLSLSTLSWYFIEKPINKLKNHFQLAQRI